MVSYNPKNNEIPITICNYITVDSYETNRGPALINQRHLSLGENLPTCGNAKLQVGIEVWIHVEGEGIPFTWMTGGRTESSGGCLFPMGIEK